MPAQQGVGGDEAMVSALPWEESAQRREDGPVWPGGVRSGDLSAHDRDLMAQHEDLGVLGRLPAGQQRKPADELTEAQVEQSERHD
jgi:hypothetical protein